MSTGGLASLPGVFSASPLPGSCLSYPPQRPQARFQPLPFGSGGLEPAITSFTASTPPSFQMSHKSTNGRQSLGELHVRRQLEPLRCRSDTWIAAVGPNVVVGDDYDLGVRRQVPHDNCDSFKIPGTQSRSCGKRRFECNRSVSDSLGDTRARDRGTYRSDESRRLSCCPSAYPL